MSKLLAVLISAAFAGASFNVAAQAQKATPAEKATPATPAAKEADRKATKAVDRAEKSVKETTKSVKETAKSATKSARENISDAALTAKIKSDFAKDKQVSALNINVDTDNKGVVTLRGNAKSKAEADKAVSLARATKGVTSVKNEIKVQAK
jgi:hyperosmotically inducible protein